MGPLTQRQYSDVPPWALSNGLRRAPILLQQLMAFARGLLERRADGSQLLPCADIVQMISERVPRPSAEFARAFDWALRAVIGSRPGRGVDGAREYKLLYAPVVGTAQERRAFQECRGSGLTLGGLASRLNLPGCPKARFERWVGGTVASFVTTEQIQNYELQKLKHWLKYKTADSDDGSSSDDEVEGDGWIRRFSSLTESSIARNGELQGKQLERELQLARGAVARAKDTRAREREEEKRAQAVRAREMEEEKRQQEEARRGQQERQRREEAKARERWAEQLSRRRATRRPVASLDEVVAASVGSRPMAGLTDILACARMGIA